MALGGENRAFVALGGATGTHHRQLLEGRRRRPRRLALPGETRTSMTVMEETATDLHYRFSSSIRTAAGTTHSRRTIRDHHKRLSVMSWAAAVCPGIATDFYGEAREPGAAANQCSLVLDTHSNAPRRRLPPPFTSSGSTVRKRGLVMTCSPRRRSACPRRPTRRTRHGRGRRRCAGRRRSDKYKVRERPPFAPRSPVPKVRQNSDGFVGTLTLDLGWPLKEAARYSQRRRRGNRRGDRTLPPRPNQPLFR